MACTDGTVKELAQDVAAAGEAVLIVTPTESPTGRNLAAAPAV
jgi:predicted amidohydrolase